MIWSPYSSLIIAIDALAASVLILLMLRKRKPVTLPADRYDALSKGGGMLTWIKVRIFVGLLSLVNDLIRLNKLLQLPEVNTATVQAAITLVVVSIGLLALTFLFSFVRKQVFPVLYIAAVAYEIAISALSQDEVGIIVHMLVESLFILYLFRSAAVAIVYGTRPVTIESASEKTSLL